MTKALEHHSPPPKSPQDAFGSGTDFRWGCAGMLGGCAVALRTSLLSVDTLFGHAASFSSQ
jgi:hypothetical protein